MHVTDARSYTVVGDNMRLDGRMITIATGDIVLAEQIAGEKARFVELEQRLMQKLIALLGVKVQPKEKAALPKAHTDYLHLDIPGQVHLWEKLYELGKTFPGIRDVDRAVRGIPRDPAPPRRRLRRIDADVRGRFAPHAVVRTGPLTTDLRADDLSYEGR